MWRYLRDDGVGAAEGLAFDEAMTAFPQGPPVLRLYTYRSHAALCGRYQHLEAEINLDACRASGTAFNRRPTGGGAIIMGEGQLGVAVVGRAPAGHRPKQILVHYAQGVVAGLNRLGVSAVFGGKNDLVAEGRKIAGLGLYLDPLGGLLFHASVLADLDIPFMLEVLDIPVAKLGERAVGAVEQRVTTVTRETGRPFTGPDLREPVARGFEDALGIDLEESDPTPEELARASKLATGKYETEEWLHQRSPQADATAVSLVKTPTGLIRLYLALSGDTIRSALFTGDFNEPPSGLRRFETALKWSRLDQVEATAKSLLTEDTGLDPGLLAAAVINAGRNARPLSAPDRSGACYYPEESP
jgi:lipoate-protein ligase A